ncbi:MAG TPA: NAD(P)/FAD-dependent oxidoreductase [Xanthobacteraceae bacterium]|nr:NAD(P)/FAD-dependent oxidoreductase [Xanthobacteraceae bacterium]
MKRISRRNFLVSGAAAVAAPAVAVAQGAGALDVIIVGAGAAGIAAARRLTAAGRRCIVLESSVRIGGRCFSEIETFGLPYDRGAHAIHFSEINPVAKLARSLGMEVYRAGAGHRLRIGQRFAREGELEAYFGALVRARRAIADAGSEERDVAASRALPKNLGEWRQTVEFVLGPARCGKALDQVSAQDLAHAGDREADGYCRQGYGAILARLAEGLPIRLATPATRIATWRGVSYVETPKGTLQARAVIVTVSTAVLAAGKIRFDPALPKAHLEAASRLSLGTYERVALELPGNPLQLPADELVFAKTSDARTAALLANVAGTPLCFVDVAGKLGGELAAQGEGAMRAFAVDWLVGLFGADVEKAVRRSHATQWGKEPGVLGAFSVAAPNAQAARMTLTEPVRDRIFFSGEATHETLWGTVGGAWEAGERAAADVLDQLGGRARRR